MLLKKYKNIYSLFSMYLSRYFLLKALFLCAYILLLKFIKAFVLIYTVDKKYKLRLRIS